MAIDPHLHARLSALLSSRRRVALVGAVAVSASLLLGTSAGVAAAEPNPTIEQVEAKIADLEYQAEGLAEEWNGARLAVEDADRKAAAAEQELTAAKSQLAQSREAAGRLAAATYRSGTGGTQLVALSSGDPQQFLDQSTSLDRLNQNRAETMTALKADQKKVTEKQAASTVAVQRATDLEREAAAKRERLDGLVAEEQSILSRLKEEERVRLEEVRKAREAEQARQAAAAQAAAAQRAAQSERASRARMAAAEPTQARAIRTAPAAPSAPARSAPSAPAAPSAPTAPVPVSGRAGIAVQTAMAQLGKPYVYGASGPNSFDCSGLTMYAWRAAGVSLPHYTVAQLNATRRVSLSDIQPGDLVFFRADLGHMGMYVGNGMYINAPQTGDVVKLRALSSRSPVAVSRVG